jgi:hypothetical protein
MAVAYDTHLRSLTFDNSSADPFTFTYTPSGTPRGICIFCFAAATSVDRFTAITYGAVSMSAVVGGFAIDTAGEIGQCKAFFLGSGIPTGAQTVSIDHDTGTTATKCVVVVSLTASGDTEIVGTPVLLQGDGTLAEQDVDSGADSALRLAAGFSGLGTQPPAGANSTLLAFTDPYVSQHGQSAAAVACRENAAGSGSRPVGFSSVTSDDRAFVHLAVKEIAAAGFARSFAVIIG